MASWRGRYINPWKWEDEWHMSLSRDEQKIFDYLLDSPRSAGTLIGVYELNLQVAAFHTKIDYQEVQRVFRDRLQPDAKAFFEMGWVVLPNWLKHQHFNPNMYQAAANEFNDLPEWLRLLIFDESAGMFINLAKLTRGVLSLERNGGEPLATVVYDKERFATVRNDKTKRNRNLETETEKKPPLTPRKAGGGRRSAPAGGDLEKFKIGDVD